jgi:uncharacterized coiled-coil protein SlyX
VRAIVERLRELKSSRPPTPIRDQPGALGGEGRIAVLEQRIQHLEHALEGLQDAVDRQNVLQDERIAELRRRTEPVEMARALSEDARKRGF